MTIYVFMANPLFLFYALSIFYDVINHVFISKYFLTVCISAGLVFYKREMRAYLSVIISICYTHEQERIKFLCTSKKNYDICRLIVNLYLCLDIITFY